MNQETQSIRDAQLANHRAEQEALRNQFPNYTNTPRVSISSLNQRLKNLVNELTALNISSLNLGNGSNPQQQVNTHLDHKLNEVYLLMKQIREEHKFTGRIFS